MNIVTSLMGVALFGTIGAVSLFSIMLGSKMPHSVSALVKSPRFILGCICFVLTAYFAFSMV